MNPDQVASFLSLASLLKDLGSMGGILLLLWLLLGGRLITKGHHDAVCLELKRELAAKEVEREWLLGLAIRSADMTDRALSLADRRKEAADR